MFFVYEKFLKISFIRYNFRIPFVVASYMFQDFRKMFDKMGKSIDACTVSTPDHMHAIAGVQAMKIDPGGISACYPEKASIRNQGL